MSAGHPRKGIVDNYEGTNEGIRATGKDVTSHADGGALAGNPKEDL